jgi:hypothetical protein
MMSLSVIARLAREQHRKAARAKLVPLVVEGEDMPDDATPGHLPPPHPNIGTYHPKGWRLGERLFVDKSGLGAEWEPAMTLRQFIEVVRKAGPGNGYGIIEEGEFQVYVGRFEPRK